jgi:hypothetical protein
MGDKRAKKKSVGNVVELDLPPTPPPEPVVKKKKELSDKQRENLSKGMAVLKAKREAKSKKEEVEVEVESTPEPVVAPPPVAPPPVADVLAQPAVVKKERKPRVVKNYLTTEDFNSFKSELLTSLKPNSVQQEYKPVASIIQPVSVPSAVAQPQIKERVISGRELLDKIFFK